MEAIVIIVILIVLGFLFSRRSSSEWRESSSSIKSASSEALNERIFKIGRELAKLSTEASDIVCNLQASKSEEKRYEKIKSRVDMLEKERNEIKLELNERNPRTESKDEKIFRMNISSSAYLDTITKIMLEMECTQDEADIVLFEKIELLQKHYKEDGLVEEKALSKAVKEVCGNV